ncbi:MAG: ZIP family metal transporter [Candidatus Bipolaricaulota bacterium]|nr:ZIP family metal transporter [Candidatus Bipolaricaulota bacterium]MDW8126687.1 ZIP family metal transporter [Candidatus Bipolaricaulota bacterium]
MLGLLGGLVITGLNAAGALLVLLWPRPPARVVNTLLGFAAGIMLSASFTSLILPGIAEGGLLPVVVGIGLGTLFLTVVDRVVPHLHLERGREGIHGERMRAVWLFILAITLHNMPEGLAVGVGLGAGDLARGLQLVLAIGLQNIPEGLAVAVSALGAGMGSSFYAGVVGIRAGVVEIPLALLGALAVEVARPLLPYAMGFAAGAMLYVIFDEIIPETNRQGRERLATLGFLAGTVAMLALDVALG